MYNLCYLKKFWPRQLSVVLVVAAATFAFVMLTAALESINDVMQLGNEPDNVLVVARGGMAEAFLELSHVEPATASRLNSVPGIARASDGEPLISHELLYAAEINRNGHKVTVSIRGVGPLAFDVHRIVTADSGAADALKGDEIVVGVGARDLLGGVKAGEELTFAGRSWRVRGFFHPTKTQTQFDSEIWVPINLLMKARRTVLYGMVAAKAESVSAVPALVDTISTNQDVLKDLRAVREEQGNIMMTNVMTAFRIVHSILTVLLMGIAAVGVLNALLNNAMRRRRDMALLRALGSTGWTVASGFVLEGALLAAAGAIMGSILSLVGRNAPISIGTVGRGAPMLVRLHFGVGTVLLAIAGAVVFGGICALIPALVSTRFSITAELTGEG